MMAIVQGSEGGRPTPDQLAEIAQLQARSNSGMRIAAGLLVISAGAMAIARYL
jgi:hypothetical protein